MSWTLPEEWAEEFDPPRCDWVVWQGPVEEVFPGVVARGWHDGEMVQRDFWVRSTCFGRQTLVVEWKKPWREVIAIIRDGWILTQQPSTLKEFDIIWR
jgi:hypothetical protein